MEQATGSVIKIRPAEMELAVPAFTPTVVSSPSNIFIQEVKAQTYTENRMVWNWRSPSSNLLCSPLIYVVFRIDLQCPYKLNKASQIGPLLGVYDTQVVQGAATAGPAAAINAAHINSRIGYGYRPMFCFSGGNSVMNACESKSITINGSTWSSLNSNQYLRSLDRCYCSDDQAQRAWGTCGGTGNKNDSVPISGHVLGLPDGFGVGGSNHGVDANQYTNQFAFLGCKLAGANDFANISSHGFRPTEGSTMDSGLARRMENFYSQIVKVAAPAAPNAATGRIYTIEIKAPVSGSVFNDLWGAQGLSRSDPRMRQALGLPHINNCQISLSFKDLFKTIIRRLGRPNQQGAANALVGAVSAVDASDVQITLNLDNPPVLRATYIRLPSFRSYPQSAALSVYRREIRRPDGTRSGKAWGDKAFAAGLWGGAVGGSEFGLRCAGDFDSMPSTLTVRPSYPAYYAAGTKDHYKDVSWTGCQFPQIPSYIFIVYSKSPSFTTYDNPLRNLGRVQPPNGLNVTQKFNLLPEANARQVFDTPAHSNSFVSKHVLAVAGADITAKNVTSTQERVFNDELAARNIAMAQDSNAAILQLEIVVQSAIGSFSFRDTQAPFLQDRDVLWRKHVRNCHSQYAPAGRSVWQDRECCALLASSDFCLGLSSSPGVQYPITLDVRVRFANRAAYSGGACFTTGSAQGKMMFEDIIVGEPTLVGLFHQNVLSIAASSAVLSSQSFSQATAAAALASS